LNIRHKPGLIISGIMHILILAIPVSFAVVQKFDEIELFVIEPILISDKKEDVALPLAIADPPEIGMREASPAPQSFASTGHSEPRDWEFGTATGPKFLHREMPVYPLMARKLGKEGVVVLRLTIDHRGNLLDVEVTQKAGYGFTEAAIEAVKRSTFLPAKRDGQPIVSRAILPIRFMLRRD